MEATLTPYSKKIFLPLRFHSQTKIPQTEHEKREQKEKKKEPHF
jgi:hypothetical protein